MAEVWEWDIVVVSLGEGELRLESREVERRGGEGCDKLDVRYKAFLTFLHVLT